MQSSIVLYFVKYPTPGKVKTRLAETVGVEKATQLYRDLATFNFSILTSPDSNQIHTWVAFDPPEKSQEITEWLNQADRYLPQEGEGLGLRLSNAFKTALSGSANSAMAVGSDTLGLSKDVIARASQELETKDIVLGPAKDGGYYLIGMKQFYPEIFEQIEWSTSKVLESTLERINSLNLSYFLLPELKDLDKEEDIDEIKPTVMIKEN